MKLSPSCQVSPGLFLVGGPRMSPTSFAVMFTLSLRKFSTVTLLGGRGGLVPGPTGDPPAGGRGAGPPVGAPDGTPRLFFSRSSQNGAMVFTGAPPPPPPQASKPVLPETRNQTASPAQTKSATAAPPASIAASKAARLGAG